MRLLKGRWLKRSTAVVSAILVLLLLLVGVYAYGGLYGINVLLRRGGSYWVSVTEDDPRLSASMRLALQAKTLTVTAGDFKWREIRPGFDVAELPVLAEGVSVDHLLLARIEPSRFRFIVRNAPTADRELTDWMDMLGAVAVINGSYYSRRGLPDTPFISDGLALGPQDYDARHGAFVSMSGKATIEDLAGKTWRDVLRGADDAMVSYPILIDAEGRSRVNGDSRWLANRSFIALDRSGRIILGTTKDAFFSLERLASFLKNAPLDLTMALNLDGGPVACQGIALDDFRRDFCGEWELAVRDEQLKLLTGGFGRRRWALPIILAVLPK